MLPSVQDVQRMLNKLAVQRVDTEVIELQIEISEIIVDGTKSGTASEERVEKAKLVHAAWLTMIAYATEMERSAGVVPAPMLTHLAVLESVSKQLLEIIRRGAPVYKAAIDQPDTLLEQYLEGEMQEAADYY